MQIRKRNGEYTATFIRYMRNAYDRYLTSEIDSIHKAYDKPSPIKVATWEEIYWISACTARIIAHNHMFYVAAYIGETEEQEECLIVETAFATYWLELKHIQ